MFTKSATKRTAQCAIITAVLLAAATLSSGTQAASALGPYNVDPNSASVSGLSSGGFMAAQLGVAYSGTFKTGFGVFAGGPYDCARSQAYYSCMNNNTPSITTALANIKSWSGNQIDATSNLANRQIYMQVGSADTTVGPNVMAQLRSELSNFDTASRASYNTTSSATHTFPTDFNGAGDNACGTSASPYVSNCSYDGAGAVLKWMYSSLNARNTGTLGGSIVAFDQTAFVSAGNGMDATGYLYVPKNCAPGGTTVCKVHVALHGCLQSYNNIRMTFINNTGYNMWADTNNIIIVYPQAIPDNTSHTTWDSGSLANGNGCWDWIGWFGANADQHGGVQMAAIVGMVNKITSGYSSLVAPTGLTVIGASNSSVSLSWTSEAGAASYNLYRNGTQVNSSAIIGTSYTDGSLTSGTSYSYTVAGVTSGGAVGMQSAAVTGTTTGTPPALPAPTGLAVTGTTASSVSLAWTAETGASSYNVYRSSSKIASGLTTNSYTDSGLAFNTSYSYTVTGVNLNGESAQSSSVSAATKSSWVCSTYAATNYDQVQNGRAHDSGGYALANGSNQNMGLDNVFYITTLAETSSNYYIIGNCP